MISDSQKSSRLVVILGPTASGKSSLAIKLARKFNGEIVSADSRQVYQGMNIGTGKVPISHSLRSKTSAKSSIPAKAGIYSGGIRHHLLNVASPKRQFTVADYKRLLKSAIAQIRSRGKVTFLVGGTAFYIYAVIDDWQIPEVKPNPKLRKALAKKTGRELFAMLKKLDPRRAKNIDKHNRVRLIRAIEIVKVTGKPVPRNVILSAAKDLTTDSSASPQNDKLILGIKKSPVELRKLINKRVDHRFQAGMVKEVKHMLSTGITFKRLEQFGLEYRYIAWYLQRKLTREQMVEQLKNAIWHFSRRQMTWFKRDKRIRWVTNQKQAEKLIRKYLHTR